MVISLKISSWVYYLSLNLVLVEEEGIVWVREVILHMILSYRHLVWILARVLIELLQDVEE